MAGLPQILIEFKGKGMSAIARSQKGTVALLVKDKTGTDQKVFQYNNSMDVVAKDYTTENFDLIKKTFLGNPKKVIVVRLANDAANYAAALTILSDYAFDYLAVPTIAGGDVADVANWVKSQRDNHKKSYKAVLPNYVADYEGIINFTTENIVVGDTTYSTAAYTGRIAGLLAGLPLSQSATYVVLPEVENMTSKADQDAAVIAGELILINDGTNIKIARGVNSLTTISGDKTQSWKKIKIVEGMDMIRKDVQTTYAKNYVGKVANTYDNKMLFLSAVGVYMKQLEKDYVLDPAYENGLTLDLEAHKDCATADGVQAESLSEKELREYNTGATVYAAGKIKFLDAMEDLKFSINM